MKKKIIKNSIIIATTALASLGAANGLKLFGKQVLPRLIEFESKEKILQKQTDAINKYLSVMKNLPSDVSNILNKAKKSALKLNEIDVLFKKLPNNAYNWYKFDMSDKKNILILNKDYKEAFKDADYVIVCKENDEIIGAISNNKIKFLYPLIVSILFIPSVWIYYNSSALIHAVWYLVVSLIGLLIGAFIKWIIKKI